MQEDVDAERPHAPRIVPDRLQPQSEGRAGAVKHGEIEEGRDRQGEIVERRRIAPVHAEHGRRLDAREAGESVENHVVLAHEIEEGDSDRQRDHDGVDAFGARSDGADEGAEQRRAQDRDDDRQPPRPSQPHHTDAVGAQDCHEIGGKSGNRHLRDADHAAIPGKHRQRQRDGPQDQRIGTDLEGEEIRRKERIGDQEDRGEQHRRVDAQRVTAGIPLDAEHLSASP